MQAVKPKIQYNAIKTGQFFSDNFAILDTKDLQMDSLRLCMGKYGFKLVYTDSSVYFRHDHQDSLRVSFEHGVKIHNEASPFMKLVHRVKLQRSKNYVDVQDYRVRPTEVADLFFVEPYHD